ncbi:immunity protein 51 of polymorphic toxin system [Breznakibacter xylanolyticus]|uniref:Immunity protein 51 of polymorphic toxin system n=1 Tax=Breznakibacter xylanolyticus TaxID=990 RepID=A0A2W7PJU0_9BACT|nr:Imm51 family immunity protein [Breznakibacter xylanolyticus]PZX09549.1 immunity protein 51 of polymorphic toxin system [Breznakibacter xylanolyticus]
MRLLSFIIGLTTLIGCSNSIEKNDKLVHAINDTSISIRGNLIKIAENDYRYDYYDVTENDSHSEYLQNKGFQGGGYSWEGIVYGAIKLSDPNILNSIRFDPEAEGLAIWSTDKTNLEKIGRLIAVVKSDNGILTECIRVAKNRLKME